jgi:hypothetical protein
MTATMPAIRRPAYVLVPLAVGAAVAVALGVYGKVHTPTRHALFYAPFPSMFAMKVWLTVAALGFALIQGLTALWIYGRLGRSAPGWAGGLHRTTGVIAFLITLPVAFLPVGVGLPVGRRPRARPLPARLRLLRRVRREGADPALPAGTGLGVALGRRAVVHRAGRGRVYERRVVPDDHRRAALSRQSDRRVPGLFCIDRPSAYPRRVPAHRAGHLAERGTMQGIESKLDKAYHGKSAQELADSPVDALNGVSPGDGELLAKAFGIKTVRDLGTNKFFLAAQAIAHLAG